MNQNQAILFPIGNLPQTSLKLSIMFGLFKKDPKKALEKEHKLKSEQAMHVQRSGDLRAYAKLIEEIKEIEDKIDALK